MSFKRFFEKIIIPKIKMEEFSQSELNSMVYSYFIGRDCSEFANKILKQNVELIEYLNKYTNLIRFTNGDMIIC